jgi:succinate dehydrogenase / fumarate reductase, flavoprotein subunit
VDEGRGVGPSGVGVYLDFRDAIQRLGRDVIAERYGNLFDMYQNITGEDPYQVPMRIYPAPHYTMGGLWVDYNLMSTIPGLYVGGEANFSDHGANRLGASALMQGLADGYFILPLTVGQYLASSPARKLDTDAPGVRRCRARGEGADAADAGHQRQPLRHRFPSRTGQPDVGALRHGPQRRGIAARRCAGSRNCARSSGTTCACRAAPPRSTSRWRSQGVSRTSSSSPS